ncbi:hypothetical protein [Noviherbaspirillum humi]|uniref:hypothetical protein n=1 Tax=Noviherbaspirillum humi TaxID=1688639 RepID=UPI000B789305|nr:hypothetical protein [Noviherbaspirillum humi]
MEPAPTKPLLSVNGAPASVEQTTDPGWWSRLMRTLSLAPVTGSRNIRIEMRHADTVLTVDWPMEKADECAAWLREALK